MPEQETCGQGLAHNAELPRRMSGLMAAMAEVLEDHMKAIDLTDAGSQPEYQAYRSLSRAQRELANRLTAQAREMAGYRSLPMAAHDSQALSHLRAQEAFRRFVARKEELLAWLQETAREDRQLLDEMGGA